MASYFMANLNLTLTRVVFEYLGLACAKAIIAFNFNKSCI